MFIARITRILQAIADILLPAGRPQTFQSSLVPNQWPQDIARDQQDPVSDQEFEEFHRSLNQAHELGMARVAQEQAEEEWIKEETRQVEAWLQREAGYSNPHLPSIQLACEIIAQQQQERSHELEEHFYVQWIAHTRHALNSRDNRITPDAEAARWICGEYPHWGESNILQDDKGSCQPGLN